MLHGSRYRGPTRLALAALFILLPLLAASAEAPVATAAPKAARSRIVAAVRAFAGTPYRYGGSDPGGFDCSGLVYRVYADTLGVELPRTARSLFSFVEPVEGSGLQAGDLVFFDTTGRLAHVGIYVGEGRFVHAASEGPVKGVMESRLADEYWTKSYAGAGRVLPPAVFFGVIISIAAAPQFGSAGDSSLRGLALSATAAYPLGGLELGLDLRPSWDGALGVFRLPLALSLGFDRRLRVFAGPALTLGTPSLDYGAGTRAYEAGGGLLATAGVAWTPLDLRLAGATLGFGGELRYDRYVAAPGEPGDGDADTRARISVGLGLRIRFWV